jgi:hypothetical protein
MWAQCCSYNKIELEVICLFCKIYALMPSFAQMLNFHFSFAKCMKLCHVLSNLWKFIHLCQILTKFWNPTLILPILWKSSFSQIIGFHFNFVKFMHLCQVLPKLNKIHIFLPNLWNYVQFCLDHGIPPLKFTFGICK